MTANSARVKHCAETITQAQSCNVVQPPMSLRRFVPEPGEGPGIWARYAEHPAYANYVRTTTFTSRLRSLVTFARYFALILTKRVISYELIPAHVRTAGRLRVASVGLRHIWQKLSNGPAFVPSAEGEATEQALVRDGICVAHVDAAQFQAIAAAVQPLIDELRQARGARLGGGREFEESRAVALRTANADLYTAVDKMFTSSGILAGISRYLGHEARLADVNPQVNDASDDFWRRTFPDRPVEPRPTSYFHRDASGGDIKAIIYLSDVHLDSGPFSYAIGSHRVRESTLVDWTEETNDQSGFSGTDEGARRRFAALPAALRRKCAFGNDLMRDQQIADRILGAEWVIQADRGHVAIFDTKGFHRGGMVKQGERVVLTCIIGSPKRFSRFKSVAR